MGGKVKKFGYNADLAYVYVLQYRFFPADTQETGLKFQQK
jgi:hypothetical protein